MTDFSTEFKAPAPSIQPSNPPVQQGEPFADPADDQNRAALNDGMDQMIARASDNPQLKVIMVNGVPIQLAPKIAAICMANLSKGINTDDFSLIMDSVRYLVHKDHREKYDDWLINDEPDMEDVMTFMQKAMEQITGKANGTS